MEVELALSALRMAREGRRPVVGLIHATLEFELIMQSDWHTKDDARRAIFQYIETWYNRKRRHSTLGYISPVEYEEQLHQQLQKAA